MDNNFYEIISEGLVLHIKLNPKTSKIGFAGIASLSSSKTYLLMRCQKPPEDGKANKEILGFLAKFFSIRQSNVILQQGHKARYKRFLIMTDNSQELLDKLFISLSNR